jgi:hypothetical protein
VRVKDPATGNLCPQYFEAGFTGGSGAAGDGVQPIPQGALAGYKLDPNTIIVRRPEWRLYQQNGDNDNLSTLTSQATALAPSYLQGTPSPAQLVVCRGFVAAELSGVLSEIRIKQTPAETTFKVQTWWLPSEYYLEKMVAAQEKHGGGAASADRAFPKQGDTAEAKNAEGHSGMTQPVVMVQAVASRDAAADMVKVKITGPAPGGGKYFGGIEDGVSTATPNPDEAQPEGMTDPTNANALIMNLEEPFVPEGFAPGMQQNMLPNGYYLGKIVGRTATNTAGTGGQPIVEIQSCRCGATNVVTIGTHQNSGTLETADPTNREDSDHYTVYLWVQTGSAYNPSGDQIEYAYYRLLRIDCGKITNISGETRVVNFTTALCS